MGQCYSVNGIIKFDNEEWLRRKISESILNTECDWHETNEMIQNFMTVKELLDLVFCKIQNYECRQLKNKSYEIKFYTDFNQSYGWESLMLEFFEDITPALRNGSSLTVYPDNDYDKLIVKNGVCVQTH